ncbi:MAG: acetyltransferase [Chloroflexia bacterium]|nr:acetyltransferase [Chloroflexia bacterium]
MALVERLTAERAQALLPELVLLLQDTVDSGAAVGFLPPLSDEEARGFWLGAIADIKRGSRLVLVALEGERVAGAVHLAMVTRTSALHRAEVQKFCVHRDFRGRGLGTLLMDAVEQAAREEGRSLLVLDTRRGDLAEQMYIRRGYVEAGSIPGWALNPDGQLHDTVFYYKML